ncbi:MAG: hypothetical protein KKB31_06145, partial [Nanoarchaeota archaeon]|nr:hypothetical protein [Nanoarchaeota archaeon]
MKRKQKKKALIGISLLIGIVLLTMVISQGGFKLPFTILPSDTKLLVPIMASLKCDVIDSSSSTYPIYDNGVWLDKTIGINTNKLTNIRIIKGNDFGFSYRVKLNICNQDRTSCSGEKSINFGSSGVVTLDDLDLRRNSYYIYTEREVAPFVWTFLRSTFSITYDKFGLKIYSTSISLAGKTICSSSCDLSCPLQYYRSNIVYTPENSLNFYESTDYLERWDEISLKDEQLGGNFWIPSRQEFCFGGFIYKAGTLNMKDGTTYTYPKTYLEKRECCPGASISITNGEKIC